LNNNYQQNQQTQ